MKICKKRLKLSLNTILITNDIMNKIVKHLKIIERESNRDRNFRENLL